MEWDSAVSAADEQQRCSLACVFLTGTTSGLGQHVEKPERPGECYCKALYGSLPVETYLCEVDATSVGQKQLAFKRADSKAMGQVLLTRYAHTTRLEWERQKAEAIEEAHRRWKADEEVRKAAVEHGGLGNSQQKWPIWTLDKLQLPYVEHDVMDFHSFLRSGTRHNSGSDRDLHIGTGQNRLGIRLTYW